MENKLYWLYFFNRKIELQIRDSKLDWKQKWWPTWPKNDFSPKGPFTNNFYEILGFLTTYPLGFTLSMVWMLTKSGQFSTTYLPRLVNVVCECPKTCRERMPAFMALIVTFIELLLEHELAWGVFQQLRGPNFTHFWPHTPLPPSDAQLWTFYINLSFIYVWPWPCMDFLLNTYLPYLAYVGFEWPLEKKNGWRFSKEIPHTHIHTFEMKDMLKNLRWNI